MTSTISEKCETLYNKLNSFVTSVISRDVTPKISNLNTEVWGSNTQTGDSRIDTLESDVSSLSTSITNLIQVQYLDSGAKSINNGANIIVQHTVTACPTGYSWLWVQKESFRTTQTDVNLNGKTLRYKMFNYSGSNSTSCFIRGYLIYYPSTWNI